MPGIQLGLGLWQGTYEGIDRLWLRWYDRRGNWISTQLEQEKRRAEQESQRADKLAAKLRQLGINPDDE